MRLLRLLVCVLVLLCLPGGVAPAFAQLPDAIGVRAQGMGGAFTALADDANAVWWNPAGLASGAFLNMVIEYGEATEPPVSGGVSHRGFALAFPALGIGYYRLPVSEIASPGSIGDPSASRQDPGTPVVRTAEVSQFGVTVGQSIGNHLVVASTLKLLHASVAGDDTEGGLDVGAMTAFGGLRAGVSVRNLREPTFGEGVDEFRMKRQIRAGGAWTQSNATGGIAIAVDGDILRVATATGEERRLALGGEVWVMKRVVGVRGGISASTVGARRQAYSAGASVAVHRGIYGEGQITGGSDLLRKGWSTGLRLTF